MAIAKFVMDSANEIVMRAGYYDYSKTNGPNSKGWKALKSDGEIRNISYMWLEIISEEHVWLEDFCKAFMNT